MSAPQPGDIVAILNRNGSGFLLGYPADGTLGLTHDLLDIPNAHWLVGEAGGEITLACQGGGELVYLDTNVNNEVSLDDAPDPSARWKLEAQTEPGAYALVSAAYGARLAEADGSVTASESASGPNAEWLLYVLAAS